MIHPHPIPSIPIPAVKHAARVAIHKAGKVTGPWEHLGFVGVAMADVAGLHWILSWLAIWLLVTGLPAAINDLAPCLDCEGD